MGFNISWQTYYLVTAIVDSAFTAWFCWQTSVREDDEIGAPVWQLDGRMNVIRLICLVWFQRTHFREVAERGSQYMT